MAGLLGEPVNEVTDAERQFEELQLQELAAQGVGNDLEGVINEINNNRPRRRARIDRWNMVSMIRLAAAFPILGITIALLVNRPYNESDTILFSFILFASGLSLLHWIGSCAIQLSRPYLPWHQLRVVPYLDAQLPSIIAVFYLGLGIAFAIKLGPPHSCGNIDYVSNTPIIAGSVLRCGLAKADTVCLFLGNPPFHAFLTSLGYITSGVVNLLSARVRRRLP